MIDFILIFIIFLVFFVVYYRSGLEAARCDLIDFLDDTVISDRMNKILFLNRYLTYRKMTVRFQKFVVFAPVIMLPIALINTQHIMTGLIILGYLGGGFLLQSICQVATVNRKDPKYFKPQKTKIPRKRKK